MRLQRKHNEFGYAGRYIVKYRRAAAPYGLVVA
jgi:hypothetical protein